MKSLYSKTKSRAVLFVFIFSLFAMPLFADCTFRGSSYTTKSPYYFVDGDCSTCVTYCCPDGSMGDEDCGQNSNLASYDELCANQMCGVGYAPYNYTEGECVECDNIPSNGYATGSGKYEDVDGYYVCPFECDEGYNKVLCESCHDYGVPAWAEYGECVKESKCQTGYTEGDDGSCCANSAKPSKYKAYISASYGGDLTTAGIINNYATLNLGSYYCRNSRWWANVSSYSCTAPLVKKYDGCYMNPFWSCFRRGQASLSDGLKVCADSEAISVGRMLDQYQGSSTAYGPCSGRGEECFYKNNKNRYELCECDTSISGFDISIKSVYLATDLTF